MTKLRALWQNAAMTATTPDPLAAFGVKEERRLVRQAGNEVYLCRRLPDLAPFGGEEIYVRLTFDDHRQRHEIEAEVAWMQRLVAAGVSVVSPVPSFTGGFVETVTHEGRQAFVIATRKAKGRPARKPDDFTPAVVSAWARLLADLHRHAAPAHGEGRASWQADKVLQVALADDGRQTRLAQRRLHELVAWMKQLPRNEANFGLCHADLHLGNMTIDEGGMDLQVIAFDFDDACHHFFLYDLAVAVTSIRKAAWERPGAFDPRKLVAIFLEAYAAHAHGRVELLHLDRFIAYRIALSTCWASRSCAEGSLDDDMTAWFERSLPWWLAQLDRL